MGIADRIKQLRKGNELSQEELAEKIGVSRQAISKWETEKSFPDIENLLIISEVFKINLDELIKGDSKFEQKLVVDGNTRKWHLLVIFFLLSILVYIIYWKVTHNIFMLGFAISTVFMLIIEIKIYFTGKLLNIF
ncbi:helix-turn-helix transcriptional regulator [Listeria sp. FSL L7-0091]|uniref:helix-turn-helix domain-containing protein n=1 Tax=Listeria farberi TaxID=2713500 RepID=UPI001628EC8B|nr:helix-turn-helix transcriptional regulator [Listeria farberi]MBC2262790.1 helix-turn-helix transcriptional regulator [Listeria farberi]